MIEMCHTAVNLDTRCSTVKICCHLFLIENILNILCRIFSAMNNKRCLHSSTNTSIPVTIVHS